MKLWNSIKNWALKGSEETQNVEFKPTNYHPKVILAWKACIEGNENITRWLMQNGYLEIVKASGAFYDHYESRTWLVKNGYPQLMAFVNACEEDEAASKWLLNYNFDQFHYMAKSVNGDEFAWEWVQNKCTEDIHLLCKTILEFKRKNDSGGASVYMPFS
jgi:hypothetical protein